MVKRQTAAKIRKTHRYLGLFIGVQFLMWTISGMYFSWTDLDEIHGDQFHNEEMNHKMFTNLLSPTAIPNASEIMALELLDIGDVPYYLINHSQLVNAQTGVLKNEISEEEALKVAKKNMLTGMNVSGIERITEMGKHHEYRGGPLPAYVISYITPENIKAYVSVADGKFKMLRHRDWRWFDFLWMTHTMDYQGRDNFNNIILRAFSLMGLITVLSGFTLWFVTSPTIRKLKKRD
ncbi:PepSY domain-containing protein [Flavobacteriaceae bacterium KMM 6897]|nr:PepSY domain-containing protein [Flavobacteriaceae bacterium KMM 6897]MEB8344495.1 PepSY domain-containing protein [Flavobacteriaceae bacterium KMM 6898]